MNGADLAVLVVPFLDGSSNRVEAGTDLAVLVVPFLDGSSNRVEAGTNLKMVSGGITKNGLSKSIVDPCGVCSLRVSPNSVLSIQYGKWTHGRCAGEESITPKFKRNFACRKCGWNI